jgi:serine/threonine protein kinase
VTRLQVLQQRVLGNGSFGVIVLASDNQGGADVAVKMEVGGR